MYQVSSCILRGNPGTKLGYVAYTRVDTRVHVEYVNAYTYLTKHPFRILVLHAINSSRYLAYLAGRLVRNSRNNDSGWAYSGQSAFYANSSVTPPGFITSL